MCWGLQPTLCFVVGELGVLVVLFLRNQGNDRTNAFAHMPIFLQEVVQAAIWIILEAEPGSAGTCSGANMALSLSEAGLVGFVPGWFLLWSSLCTASVGDGRRCRAYVLLWGVYTILAVIALIFLQMLGICPLCTVSGPWGHQIWPFLVIKPWILKLFLMGAHGLVYISCVALAMLHVRKHGSVAIGLVTVWWCPPIAYLVIGDEWGSFWCFSASVMCVFYLFEPCLLRRIGHLLELKSDPILEWTLEPARSNSALLQAFNDARTLLEIVLARKSHLPYNDPSRQIVGLSLEEDANEEQLSVASLKFRAV